MPIKRLFDIFGGVILTIILFGPICIVALLIKLTSKGPILHWSERKGINDVDFLMPKFRSMVFDSPIASSEGIDQNNYMTPIGLFIRKYSIDELPQLFSILKGDISFVGPRPALNTQYNLILFRKDVGINLIVPGLTGLAQTNGRNSMTVEDKVYYDLEYIKNQTLWFDIKIMFRTLYKIQRVQKHTENDFISWPSYTPEEAEAVKDVILSYKINENIGEKNGEFERIFSSTFGIKYSATASSGSVALELALRACGVKAGDEVIVSPRSFFASASCVVNIGATPVFVDVDIESGNITSATISDSISSRSKAIICVHLGGEPCDLDSIMTLARKHDLFVIEDCAQALGAMYKGKSVGSFGDIGVWSFCNDKILSTGEGGMLTTNNEVYINKINTYKNHGRDNKDSVISNNFVWGSSSFGSNFRMTEMQAAIGIIQLSKIHIRNKIREKYAGIICQAFKDNSEVFRVPRPSEFGVNVWYRIYVFIKPEGLKDGYTRDMIIDRINLNGVKSNSGSCPEIYLEECFVNSRFAMSARLPIAKKLGETSIAIAINPNIPIEIIYKFASLINIVATEARKSPTAFFAKV